MELFDRADETRSTGATTQPADTTSAYYQVSKEMKREAVDTLRVHAMDRHGGSAPMGSAAAYEARSIAVPWGNCVEPSNVKAGGKACPIRFQCSGCSSYRPEPSHLPAIEDQVRSLKANLELARDECGRLHHQWHRGRDRRLP
ncbi:MAG: hypothetical protein ACRDTT_15875, partial [Pseudonocardiaceae bacterium]